MPSSSGSGPAPRHLGLDEHAHVDRHLVATRGSACRPTAPVEITRPSSDSSSVSCSMTVDVRRAAASGASMTAVSSGWPSTFGHDHGALAVRDRDLDLGVLLHLAAAAGDLPDHLALGQVGVLLLDVERAGRRPRSAASASASLQARPRRAPWRASRPSRSGSSRPTRTRPSRPVAGSVSTTLPGLDAVRVHLLGARPGGSRPEASSSPRPRARRSRPSTGSRPPCPSETLISTSEPLSTRSPAGGSVSETVFGSSQLSKSEATTSKPSPSSSSVATWRSLPITDGTSTCSEPGQREDDARR